MRTCLKNMCSGALLVCAFWLVAVNALGVVTCIGNDGAISIQHAHHSAAPPPGCHPPAAPVAGSSCSTATHEHGPHHCVHVALASFETPRLKCSPCSCCSLVAAANPHRIRATMFSCPVRRCPPQVLLCSGNTLICIASVVLLV